MEEYLELWIALFTCLALFGFYIPYALLTTASGGHPFGELLGVVGMLLMLATETVYSMRKRIRGLQWAGPLRLWLSLHIFTGIVGPFLVVLHSAFAVGGMAGVALALTGVVVASGLVGRYIYTAVPRTRAGVEFSRDELSMRAATLERELEAWAMRKPVIEKVLAERARAGVPRQNWARVFMRTWDELEDDRQVRAALRDLERTERARLGDLKNLLKRQRQLERQIGSLDSVHYLMGVWRSVHVPLGAALFTAAFIHVIAALYFRGGLF